MRLLRYRMPSVNTILGITKAKKQIKKELGIYKVTKYTNAPANLKRRAKRAIGYESEGAKLFRFISRMLK